MTRHLKCSYISIFTNLLLTDNETKSVKFKKLYAIRSIKKKIKKIKSRPKRN